MSRAAACHSGVVLDAKAQAEKNHWGGKNQPDSGKSSRVVSSPLPPESEPQLGHQSAQCDAVDVSFTSTLRTVTNESHRRQDCLSVGDGPDMCV